VSAFAEIRHCTVELRKLFLTSMSGISTFRDSFRRIRTVILYRSLGSNKLQFCCGP